MTQALNELIADLAHDLGKYLTLGLRFLPADAMDAEEELVAAVREGLLGTRRSGDEVLTARQVWTGWLAELDRTDPSGRLRGGAAFAELERTVERALAWGEPRLDDARIREAAQQVRVDLLAVPAAIRTLARELREEAEHGG